MARFYGWTPKQISNLSIPEFYSYLKSIPILRANEQLHQLVVADYPHLKDDARKKVHQNLTKQATSFEEKKKSKTLSNEELFKMIAGR